MHNNGDSGLSLKNLSIYYGSLEVIRDVTFEVPEGKIVSLLGANGSGKSTILRTVSGLKKPARGEIWFQGMRIDKEHTRHIINRGIAHVPERRGLFPDMTVHENLLMGAYSRKKAAKKELACDIEEVYQYFPVLKTKRKKQAVTLSGGEAELLAIARALMSKPKLLLMDEPLQGISPVVVEKIAELIINLKKSGITILMVEHNIAMAFELSDWICIMDTGKLETQGEPHTLSQKEFVRKSYLGVCI
jgi:branched-chain amino acid transport system ATP-binding protein